jgi:hypothetical protein
MTPQAALGDRIRQQAPCTPPPPALEDGCDGLRDPYFAEGSQAPGRSRSPVRQELCKRVFVSNLRRGISYHTINRDWAAAGPIKFVSVVSPGTAATMTTQDIAQPRRPPSYSSRLDTDSRCSTESIQKGSWDTRAP